MMCKVVKYWFACNHGFRLRHSKCGGTKHKSTRSGLATACRSEAYLNFVFTIDCGPCQHQAFEDGWTHKLRLADTFLEKLNEKRLLGVREVEALVEQLKEDFSTATWETRALFPHAHKERKVRVSLGQFHNAPSPLSSEVLPEEIPKPVEVIGPDYPDYEYAWDYVASTDPIHPVDTNYAHPLDNVDPSWMLNHLSPDEFEQSGEGIGFDASEADNMWHSSPKEVNAGSMDRVEDTWASEATGFNVSSPDANQTPERSRRASQTEPCTEDGDLLSEHVDMVIQCFWRVVHGTTARDRVLHSTMPIPSDNLGDAFRGLHISNLHELEAMPQKSLPTPPPTPPRFSIDGSFDFDSCTSAPSFVSTDSASPCPVKAELRSSFVALESTGLSAPKSTSSYYDKWRQRISSIKGVDRAAYNKELLYLSRYEIKDVEGPNGRFVVDPQLPRDSAARTGWWK